MTNTAETSVTDFFTLPKLGRVSGSTNVWTGPCLKSGWVLTHGPGGNWRLCPEVQTTQMTKHVHSWIINDRLWILAVLRPPEWGLRRGEKFWLRLTTTSAQCLRLWALFSFFNGTEW